MKHKKSLLLNIFLCLNQTKLEILLENNHQTMDQLLIGFLGELLVLSRHKVNAELHMHFQQFLP